MNPVKVRPWRSNQRPALPKREFNRRATFVAALVGAGVLLLLLFWLAGKILLVAFAGILLAILLQALSEALSKRIRLRYGWSFLIVVSALIFAMALVTWLVGAEMIKRFSRFSELLPAAIQTAIGHLEQQEWGAWLLEQLPDWQQAVPQTGFFSRVTGIASQTFDFLINVAIILFVGVYGAAEPERYRRGLLRLIPQAKRPRADEVLRAITKGLHWWLVGRLFAMVVIAVLTWIGLSLLGVPLAIPLALIAGSLQIIPNVGPFLSGIPAVLVGFTESAAVALYVVLLYLLIQFVESYILTPLVEREALKLPPALTIMAMALMSLLAGAVGLLVAAPLTVVTLIAVKMLYIEDVLRDYPSATDES